MRRVRGLMVPKVMQAVYVFKCATAGDVLVKKSDPDNMTSEELRKVISPLRHQNIKQYKKIQ